MKYVVDDQVNLGTDPDVIDDTQVFEVKLSGVAPPPPFPWWLLLAVAGGIILVVAVTKK